MRGPKLSDVFAVSQIIGKNLEQFATAGPALWINPEADDCWREVRKKCGALKLFSQDYGTCTFLRRTGAECDFSAFPAAAENKYEWVVMNLPRQKALLAMMLDCAASLLSATGRLWLAGENRAGIKSADKLLRQHFGRVRKLDNARHCSLYEAEGRLKQVPFEPGDYRQFWKVACASDSISIASYPGVFAHGRLDAGTALLLDTLAGMQLRGDVLDFACGAGVIGTCIARQHADTRVTLLDSSALALRSCGETLQANHLQATIIASDGLEELTGEFDLVVSNPPIHAGVKTDPGLGMRLLDSINRHIRTDGRLILVANVHLPYENWLSKHFSGHRKLASNGEFKILMANK